MNKIGTLILLLQIFTVIAVSQEWTVPEDRKGRLSPFQFNDSIRKSGMQLFNLNCMSCHGTPGMGNFQPLVPPPGDPATDKVQHNSDGELFYKISEGRGPMPSFKNSLGTGNIWNVIAYLRSFNTTYVQSVAPEITSSAYPGALISIRMQLDADKDSLRMHVLATKDAIAIPVKDAGLRLYLKRTFGQMMLDEERYTNAQGVATFAITSDIPGDTAGNLQVSARFSNEDLFGALSKDTVIQAGVRVVPVSLIRERAMWNVFRKAPYWILISYFAGVLLVWGFIFFVLLKLRDIFIIGEHFENKKEIDEKI